MEKFFTPRIATAVIMANMIGSGVFTSLGYQIDAVPAVFPLLMLWVIGGVAALCGAISYAELGAAMPRSGGEYNFLGRIYHPMAGFISGWISATIGFAAPIAAVAIGFGKYSMEVIPGEQAGWYTKVLACALVIVATLIHSRNRRASGQFQLMFTGIKIGLVLAFCLAAFLFAKEPQAVSLIPQSGDLRLMTGGAFAVSLIYVSYSYMGWNAATYISGELENPQRDLPRILLTGTALVMFLYVLLNFAFLYAAPMSEMAGKLEVGYIAASHIFGDVGGRLVGGMLAILLISSVSAMTLAGPRALQAIGEDFKALRFLGKTNNEGMPANAIFFQSAIALIFIITSSFKFIVIFAGAMLALNNFLAILGVFVLRWRQPDLPRPYRVWAFPVTPLLFMIITAFTLIYICITEPEKAAFGLALIAAGALFYFISTKFYRN